MPQTAILFIIMCLVWGFTWIPSKIGLEHVPPMFFAAIRYCIAAPLMLAMAQMTGGIAVKGSIGRLIISALLVNTGCYALLFWGVIRAPTGIAAIVNMASMPLFSIVLGRLHGVETIDRRKLAAIALGAVGLALLYANRLPGMAGTSREEALGLAAVLGASLSYCWGAVLSRPLTSEMSALSLAGWQSTIGALSLLALSLTFEGAGRAELEALATWPASGCLAYMIVGGTLLGYLIFLRLLRDWGPFRAGLYAFVSPVVAAIAGVVFMQESFGWLEGLGGVVMFASAGLAITAQRAPAASAPAATRPPPRAE